MPSRFLDTSAHLGRTMVLRAPLWAYFPVAAFLLWAGLSLTPDFLPNSVDAERLQALRQAPLWVLVLVPLVEALLWTVAFVEAGARLHATIIGAIAGVVAYSLVFHASTGFWGVVVTAWIGAVLNAAYMLMRGRSRIAATFNTIALRWAFIAYAYYTALAVATNSAA